jgi:hypothetical protein
MNTTLGLSVTGISSAWRTRKWHVLSTAPASPTNTDVLRVQGRHSLTDYPSSTVTLRVETPYLKVQCSSRSSLPLENSPSKFRTISTRFPRRSTTPLRKNPRTWIYRSTGATLRARFLMAETCMRYPSSASPFRWWHSQLAQRRT